MNESNKDNYDAMLIWHITNRCNFSCPQCLARAEKAQGYLWNKKINLKKIRPFFAGTPLKLLIHMTGGEPFLVKNFIEVMQVVSERHYLYVISNLVSPKVAEFAEKIDPERVTAILASAHIMELEKSGQLNIFINNCLLLKAKGFPVFIKEVAYPFRLNSINKYRNLFNESGLNLEFELFRGTWKEKVYPDAYTTEDLKLINPDKNVPSNMSCFDRKGMPCNAGFNIAVANSDGEITPCYQVRQSLGHIYKRLELKNQLMICPFESCGCPFPIIFPSIYERALTRISHKILE